MFFEHYSSAGLHLDKLLIPTGPCHLKNVLFISFLVFSLGKMFSSPVVCLINIFIYFRLKTCTSSQALKRF